MITIADVARHAGVTAATVSHVLTGKAAVREPTRKRVQAAIDELGYRPNLLARALANGTTRLLVLLVPANCDQAQLQAVTRIVAAIETANCYAFLSLHQDASPSSIERFLPYQIGGVMVMETSLAYGAARFLAPLGVPLAFCVAATDSAARYHPVLLQPPHSPASDGSGSISPITLSTTAYTQKDQIDLAQLEKRVQTFLTGAPARSVLFAEAARAATQLLLTTVVSPATTSVPLSSTNTPADAGTPPCGSLRGRQR